MEIKSANGHTFFCHDWDSAFHHHIRSQDPIENFCIGKEREVLTNQLNNRKLRSFVDVGAHLGFWSLYMSNIFKTVHSFEPNSETYDFLKKNTENNKNIFLYDFALGDDDSFVDMSYFGDNSGMSKVVKNGTSTKCTTLDSLNLIDLDLIKLDCEGFEFFVLKGAEKTIRKYQPIIVLETNGLEKVLFDLNGTEVNEFLSMMGYKRIFHHDEDPGVTSNSIYIFNQ
jgi:FkbM family methyltransferase